MRSRFLFHSAADIGSLLVSQKLRWWGWRHFREEEEEGRGRGNNQHDEHDPLGEPLRETMNFELHGKI